MEKLRDIDKRLVIGILLTLGFLILWLLTLPGQENALQRTLLIKDTAQEEQQRMEDIDNFNRATIMDNNYFCDEIIDSDMKTECKKIVVRRAEIEAQQEIPPETIEDIDNFNRATILKDPSYCEQINDAGTKKQCLEEVK